MKVILVLCVSESVLLVCLFVYLWCVCGVHLVVTVCVETLMVFLDTRVDFHENTQEKEHISF